MNEITQTLNRLRATQSSLEKKAILEETKSELLGKIFTYTYNHFIKFGISNVDMTSAEYSESHPDDWFDCLFMLLDSLKERKVTGNMAREAIHDLACYTTEEDAQLLLHILKKDLRTGTGIGLINKVYIDLLPESFCMAANKYSEKHVTFPVWVDDKLDGVRCIATILDNNALLLSRNGRAFKNYSNIENQLLQLSKYVDMPLDGEITMGHFQDLMKTMGKKDEGLELGKNAVYNIFDIIDTTKTFAERRKVLQSIIVGINELTLTHIKVVSGSIMHTTEDLNLRYEDALARGEEGLMIKRLDAYYEFKRANAWLKMKPEHSDDLEIVGVEEGNGKYKGQLGAFICRLENGGEVHVGSGLKDEDRLELWQRQEELIGSVIELKYQEKTRDGSLRFPVFIRFRQDKE